jgi:catechol 2,3-dioxygenase-like lactoylglutathione lyase family enzyme
MSTRLALVTILVQDMPRAKAFYTDLLGFEVIQDFSSPAGDFLFLHSGASETNIALQDATGTTYGVPLVHGGIMLGFAVEDADAVYREWQSKPVEILGEVGDMGAGRMFPARDPDGNYIQVYHLYPQVQDI